MLKLVLCGALALMSTSLIHAASCIISGSIERLCASEVYTTVDTVESRVSDKSFLVLPSLETRYWSEDFSVLPKFNSTQPIPFVISIH